MNKKIITNVIINVLVGLVIWFFIDLIICAIKKESFVDTYFAPQNLIEMIVIFTCCGIGYYWSLSKKNKK